MLRYVLNVFVGDAYRTFVVRAHGPDEAMRKVLRFAEANGLEAKGDGSRAARLASHGRRRNVTPLPD
ncbi:MAG TPA: hypothetical protein VHB21_24010 [Minicystis sp.]|nr:hypothetical protein [Minicystis sp.]